MKIFGSISELVDLAFRLAGGKQVKLLSRTQNTSGDTIQAYIPDVSTTGDIQDIILTKAIQTLTNKTLTSPDINGGTIDEAVIGASIPAAGSFTDIIGASLDVSGAASVNSFQIDSLSTAGLLHNDSSGNVSSSLLVDADVSDEAQISLDKLQDVLSNQLLIGDGVGDISAVSVKSGSDVSFTYDAGEVDVQIVAGAVGDNELAEDISRSKLAPGNAYRLLANDASGEISEHAALTPDELVVTDANGQLTTVAGVDSTELGYLNGLTSNVQDQIDSKADSSAVAALTTDDIAEGSNLYFTDARAKGAAVDDIITDGVTDVAPSQNAVFDALALKADSSSLGTIASQDSDSVTITGGSLSGVSLDVLDQDVESVPISSNSLSISKGVVNVSGTGPINTLSSSLNSGSLVFLKNASGADLVVSNGAGNILTGTGEDFDFLAGAVAPFLYDGTNWNLAGGAGAGAGGAGVSREISQSLHGFLPGDVLYFDSVSSEYAKAKADAENTAEVVGIVSEKKDNNTFVLLSGGYIEGLSGLTAGSVHYLSSSTVGLLTPIEPGVIGEVSKPVLIADSTSSGYLVNYRGVVVGGSNARTSLSLNNNGSTNIQDMSQYDAGELSGWVFVDATSPLRYYVEAQVSKNGAGDDYNISYQTSGDTPPAGFDMNVSSAGMVSVVLPDVSGFSSANINYSLNAAAVGVDLPLSISGENILEATSSVRGTVKKNRLLYKVSDQAYTASTPGGLIGILPVTNVPQGLYKVTIGAEYINQRSDQECTIQPQLNGSSVSIASGVWHFGYRNSGASGDATYAPGDSSTLLVNFPNATNSFSLNFEVGTLGGVQRPYYILEKLENYEEITTEWD
jgi:hypothetical protein